MTETSTSPEPVDPEPVDPDAADTSALDQSAESLDLARDALSTVAANDDVTTGDEAEAGTLSQDPAEADAAHPESP